jgi:hypothetical protein
MANAVTALDFLLAGGIDVQAVHDRLPHVDPSTVEVRIASPTFRRLWAEGIAAVTTPWAVYVQPSVMERQLAGGDTTDIAVLMVHELVHVEQLARLGIPRQVVLYAADYVRGRARRLGHWDAYRAVRFEIEARRIASEFMPGSPL